MAKVNHIPSQNKRILDYLEKKGSITQKEAERYCAVQRLASRITDLRKRGYNFESEWITVKNRYGETSRVKRYRLSKEGVE